MSVTIRDIMKLPCMRNSEIIAGKSGIDNVVTAVTALEYSSHSENQDKIFYDTPYNGADIVITAYASLAENPEALLNEIRVSHASGEAGAIVYYMDLFVKEFSQDIIDFANNVGYPIIAMPRDQYQLRYSEAIAEIQGLIIEDQNKTENFVPEIIDNFTLLPEKQQNLNSLLRLLSNYIHKTIIVLNPEYELMAFAGWPSILEREANEITAKVISHTYNIPYKTIEIGIKTGRPYTVLVSGTEDDIKKSILDQIENVISFFLKIKMSDEGGQISDIELIRAILTDDPLKIRKLATNIGVNADALTNLIIFRENSANAFSRNVVISTVREGLEKYCKNVLCEAYSGDVVALVDDGASSHWLALLKSIRQDLLEKGIETICVYGRNLLGPSESRDAYLTIMENLEDTRKIYRKATTISYHEIMYTQFLKELISQGEDSVIHEMDPIKYIRYSGPEIEDELIKTLSSFYFDNGMSVSRTARELYIHENTVKYRLKKVSDVLGCHVTDMPEMMELYKALALKRILD